MAYIINDRELKLIPPSFVPVLLTHSDSFVKWRTQYMKTRFDLRLLKTYRQ